MPDQVPESVIEIIKNQSSIFNDEIRPHVFKGMIKGYLLAVNLIEKTHSETSVHYYNTLRYLLELYGNEVEKANKPEAILLQIDKWATEKFGPDRMLSSIYHLQQEIQELIVSLKSGDKSNARLEYADCVMLIFNSARCFGMNFIDVMNAVSEKFSIVKTRKYGDPDENGVCHHI
jgi:NTP pyrophosphatase (non-canonical NTP hydrolase)